MDINKKENEIRNFFQKLEMNTIDLKKNTKEELIIYIEKLSRNMTHIQEENLELRKINQEQSSLITQLLKDNGEIEQSN